MKKKFLSVLLALCMILTMLPLGSMFAFAATSGDFTYKVLSETDKTCEITGYSGTATELHIPYKLNGYTVVKVGGMYSNANLKTVWIPNSVTELKGATFCDCSNLECVVIGNGVTSISRSSFKDCLKLKKVVLHSNVKNIDNQAFFDVPFHSSVLYGYKNTEAENYHNGAYNSFKSFYVLPTITQNKEIDLYYSMGETTVEEVCFSLYITVDATNIAVFDRNGTKIENWQRALESGMTFRVSLLNGNISEYSLPNSLTGDTNNDGTIDDWDSVLLDRYLAGWEVEVNTSAADMDENGVVDDWDGVLLARKLAGWN